MGTSAADDSEPEGTRIDEILDRMSDRFWEGAGRVKPNNPKLWKRGIKIALSLLLTAMYVYWVLAWGFDVQLFEF